MELQEMKSKLVEWIGQMKHGYRDPKLFLWEFETADGEKKNKGIRILLFTENNEYSIVAYPKRGKSKSCTSGCL